eukprot:7970677-Ditylum_brightwellii.AAC.1
MDNFIIEHNTSVLSISPLALEVENGKIAKEMTIDELKTLLLPLVGRLKRAKETHSNRNKSWLWWISITIGASGHNHI